MSANASATVLSVLGLRKTYGSLAAVDAVSLAVAAGEVVGLLGPNGAGKTTTLECIEGLRRPDEGEVRIASDGARRSDVMGVQLQTGALPLESGFQGVLVDREVGDPWAADSWLAVRDLSGDLRQQLEANGALADGTLTFTEVQQLLYSVLKAQGNPVSLDVMLDSTHDALSRAGRKVLLAAFPKAAAKD